MRGEHQKLVMNRMQQGDYPLCVNGRHWWANAGRLQERLTPDEVDALQALEGAGIVECVQKVPA